MCYDDGKLAGNPGEKSVRFCGGMVSGMPACDTHVDFKVVDGPFHNRADFIEPVPFRRITLDAGKHPQ